MNRQQAMALLRQMHLQRASQVSEFFSGDERLEDSGSARAERVADWPVPIGDEDFDGFFVVTNRQLIYSDRIGTICMPWVSIKGLEAHSIRLPGTTGIEIKFVDGRSWAFSGNTPFVKDLIRYHRSGGMLRP